MGPKAPHAPFPRRRGTLPPRPGLKYAAPSTEVFSLEQGGVQARDQEDRAAEHDRLAAPRTP